jgi:hypothetical protein
MSHSLKATFVIAMFVVLVAGWLGPGLPQILGVPRDSALAKTVPRIGTAIAGLCVAAILYAIAHSIISGSFITDE